MSGLSDIPVKLESASFRNIGLPILHEIRHALRRLAESQQSHTIDLQAIPFGPGDEELLLEVLGQGEVSATIEALGPTLIHETAYPGVWLLDYRNEDDGRIAFQIEITDIPSLLKTQPEDLANALERFEQRLKNLE
jgi:hydrogenase-1 operon protein HyaF